MTDTELVRQWIREGVNDIEEMRIRFLDRGIRFSITELNRMFEKEFVSASELVKVSEVVNRLGGIEEVLSCWGKVQVILTELGIDYAKMENALFYLEQLR